ncbi:MAG TPA: hypothetical protein EYP08_03490, partial [Pyrodictiaceae archaeon]|nr:hypothetical protein [Pyrodictiaceae archaeon]
EVLAPEVLARMHQAYASDTPVRIAEPDTDPVTQSGTNGRLQWRFRATNVRDVAFSLAVQKMVFQQNCKRLEVVCLLQDS